MDRGDPSFQRATDFVEYRADLCADKLDGHDDAYGDQTGDQGVFDRSHACLVVKKIPN